MKLGLITGLILGTLSAGPGSLAGQAVPQVSGGPGWVIRSAAHVDLWYHGLAVAGYEGITPLSLYASDYPVSVRRAKEAQGIYPTTLDRLRSYFRVAFATDSSFEILHLLPLYFGSPDPEPMLAALSAAARGEPGEELGAQVLTRVLAKKHQREIAGRFVAALEEEWRVFLRARREAETARREAFLAAAERQWREQLEPALQGFLTDRRFDRGLIVASPAVGPEGRVLLGQLDGPDDHIVAVSLPLGLDDTTAVLLHAVRELCYPIASREVARQGVHGDDRITATRTSSQAAVRCGAMLLEVRAPGLAPHYREIYVRAAHLAPDRVTLEEAYPVDAQLLKDIRRELRLPPPTEAGEE